MARKKSEFVRSLGIAFQVFMALVNEVMDQGGTDDDVRRIETDTELRKELATLIVGKKEQSAPPPPPPLLTLAGTVTVQLAWKFFAVGHFTQKNAWVKISYIGDNFTTWLLGKTEERAGSGEAVLRYHTLNKSSVDASIIAELGGETQAETTLAEVFALMAKQANGEAGALLTNGYANIFYVRDVNGVLRAVDVDWDDDAWSVFALSVEDPRGWCGGGRMFSR
jgi:hypothetical protein